MRLALAQVRPHEHHCRAGRRRQQNKARDIGRNLRRWQPWREQMADEQRSQQRHRERFYRPIDEQRDTDAAPMLAHLTKRAKVDLQKHRDDHQPDQPGHGQIDPGDLRACNNCKQPGQEVPKCDARDDTEGHPQREITFEQVHRDYATSGRELVAPSPRPISRSRVPSDRRSMLCSGRLVKIAMRFFR